MRPMRRGATTSRWRNSRVPRFSRRFRCLISMPGRLRSWPWGLGAVMALRAMGISRGEFSIGLFVAGNAILIQLYQPLNLLGTVYREITQGLVDMEAMFRLLNQPQEVQDKPDAKQLVIRGGEIRFEDVVFAYDPERTVLKGI